jgi:hypothetical protein
MELIDNPCFGAPDQIRELDQDIPEAATKMLGYIWLLDHHINSYYSPCVIVRP